jgi:hypothetical protein
VKTEVQVFTRQTLLTLRDEDFEGLVAELRAERTARAAHAERIQQQASERARSIVAKGYGRPQSRAGGMPKP